MKQRGASREKRIWVLVLALAVAAFILFNLVVEKAQARFGLTLDLTEGRLYELSETTVAALEGAEAALLVVAAEADYPSMFREMLARYARLPGVTVRYADPSENPVLIDRYVKDGLSLAENDLIVERGERARLVKYDDLLVSEGGSVTGVRLEQALTAAILAVNSADAPVAAVLTGHGERPSAALTGALEQAGFTARTLSTAAQALGNPALAVMAAPAYDYSEDEIEALADYLNAGGRLMAFIEPSGDPMPRLEALFAAWGMTLQGDVVFEPSACIGGNPAALVPMYASHPINEYFADHPVYVVTPSARSIELSALPVNGATARAVLLSTSDAYAKTDLAFTSAARDPADQAGPFALAAACERTAGGARSAVFLAGSRLFYADDVMRASAYANRIFLARALNWLWEEAQAVSIPPKMLDDTALAVTARQTAVAGAVLAGVLPLLALAVGAYVLARRRRA